MGQTTLGFQGLAIKGVAVPAFLSLGSLALGKASHHIVRTLKQPHGRPV